MLLVLMVMVRMSVEADVGVVGVGCDVVIVADVNHGNVVIKCILVLIV